MTTMSDMDDRSTSSSAGPRPARAAGGPVRRIVGAVMLGIGAIFQPKVRPGDHWSTSPKLTADIEVDSEALGRGDDDLDSAHLPSFEPLPYNLERPGRRHRRDRSGR
jgi:hypothetical protein